MKTTMRSAMWNVECNARWWTDELASLELITGVRYVNLQERLAIFTDDDGLTVVDASGNPDLTREANYAMKTENQIAAPQLGWASSGYCTSLALDSRSRCAARAARRVGGNDMLSL